MRLTAVILAILVLPTIMADIRMNVVSYSPDTNRARILVANIGTEDYNDITFGIDDNPPMEFPGSLLKAGTAIMIPKGVVPGLHNATVTTREGAVFKQELLFAQSGRQIIQTTTRVKAPGSEVQPVESVGENKGAGSILWLIVIVVLLAVAAGAFWYVRSNPRLWAQVKVFFGSLWAKLTRKPVQKTISRPGIYTQAGMRPVPGRMPPGRFPVRRPMPLRRPMPGFRRGR